MPLQVASFEDFGAAGDLHYDYGLSQWFATDDTSAIQAAFDSGADIIGCEHSGYAIGDTLMAKRPIRVFGANTENWYRRQGDTTVGTPHPQSGTIIKTIGSGVGRQWTDTGVSDRTNWTAAIALMCPGTTWENFTLRTGDGDIAWDSGFHFCGTGRHKINNVDVRGGFYEGAAYMDATWSGINPTVMNLPQCSTGIDPTLYDNGLTGIQWTGGNIAGVRAVVLQGRKAAITGTNIWSFNGCSDTIFSKVDLTNDGADIIRLARGSLIALDYQLPGGPNNSGQNLTFDMVRLDINALDAVVLDRIHMLRIKTTYGETGSTWFNAHGIRGQLKTTANTGNVLIEGEGTFFNFDTPTVTDKLPRDFIYRDSGGDKIQFKGGYTTDYAGTWTPTVSTTNNDTTHTYIYNIGRYTKVNNTVHLTGQVKVNGAMTGTGTFCIKGLPYPVANFSGAAASMNVCEQGGLNITSGKVLNGIVNAGTSLITLGERGNVSVSNLTSTSKFGPNFTLFFDLTYEAG